jgi:uncharacterized protein (TIGR03083 family)
MDPAIKMLFTEWDALDTLIDEIESDDWREPSILPHWTNADILAHIIGTERFLSGEPTPDVLLPDDRPYPNTVAELNDRWVASLRSLTPTELIANFRATIAYRRQILANLDEAELAKEGWTPVGEAPFRRFLQIRVFDCYVHELDLRASTNHPGASSGAVAEYAMDEVERALGYIVGKQAQLSQGSSVRLKLTGGVERTFNIQVDERARLVPELGTPTTELELDSTLFMALACGRLDPTDAIDEIHITGNDTIAKRVVEHLAYTI